MEVNEQLVRAVTQAVVAQLMASGAQPQNVSSTPAPEGAGSFAGKTRMRATNLRRGWFLHKSTSGTWWLFVLLPSHLPNA